MGGLLSQIRWRPQIGDPSIMGWLTVVAYAAAAVLCVLAATRTAGGTTAGAGRRERRLWLAVAVAMAFLCVNKQLDLQSLLTDIGRAVANQGGWYGQRRIVQRWFVAAVAAGGAAVLAVLAWTLRAVLKEKLLLLVGLTTLVTFIIIRAASFHKVDVIIMSDIFGVRVNWILELTGIALVGLAAVRAARPPRPAGPGDGGGQAAATGG